MKLINKINLLVIQKAKKIDLNKLFNPRVVANLV